MEPHDPRSQLAEAEGFPAPPDETPRRAAKRVRILEAAMEVFAEAGFAATNVADIATRARVGKGTLYEYYRSKDELFVGVLGHLASSVASTAVQRDRAAEAGESAADRLIGLFDMLLDQHLEMSRFAPLMIEFFSQAKSGPKELRDTLHRMTEGQYAGWIGFVRHIVDDGIAAGELRSDTDVEALANGLGGALDGLVLQRALLAEDHPIARQSVGHLRTFIRGVVRGLLVDRPPPADPTSQADPDFPTPNPDKPMSPSTAPSPKSLRSPLLLAALLLIAGLLFGAAPLHAQDGEAEQPDADTPGAAEDAPSAEEQAEAERQRILDEVDANDDGEITPSEILDYIDDLHRSDSSHGKMRMEIKKENTERSIEMETWSKGEEKSLFRILEPARERGYATLRNGDDIWNYLPRTNRTVRLNSAMMGGSWNGSHFTNNDLVRESRMAEDYDFEITHDGPLRGYNVYQIQCMPKEDAAVEWGKVMVTVNKDTLQPMFIVYFDEDMEAARYMTYHEIKEIGGRRVPTEMRVVPADNREEYTKITILEMEYDAELDDDIFSLRNLSR